MNKMLLKNMSRSLAVALAMTIVFTACKKEISQGKIQGRFTFVKGKVLLNNKRARLGGLINSTDAIEVQAKSGAVIQFSNKAVITLNANTKLEVTRLVSVKGGQPVIDLNQTKGSSFNKILSGKSQYKLRTPTVVAGVRGTSFQVNISEDNNTTIRLHTGKVQLNTAGKLAGKTKTVMLEAGSKVSTASGKGLEEPVKLSAVEVKVLENLEKIEIVQDEKKLERIIEQKESIKIDSNTEQIITEKKEFGVTKAGTAIEKTDDVKKSVAAVKNYVAPRKLTISDLKAKYGELSIVKTKDGRTYIGAFKQSQGKMMVITVNGTVRINSVDIKKVGKYKG